MVECERVFAGTVDLLRVKCFRDCAMCESLTMFPIVAIHSHGANVALFCHKDVRFLELFAAHRVDFLVLEKERRGANYQYRHES